MSATYGIVGFPVAHSRSPEMQRAAFRSAGLVADYVRFEVEPSRLGDAVRGLWALGVAGANVTLPHKQTVMHHLARVTTQASAIGAVNTLVRETDGFVGHNTDALGLANSLEAASIMLGGARVVVVGAGGAARAAVVGLAARGARSIHVAARRETQAEELVQGLEEVCGACCLSAASMATLPERLSDATLLVQSTSATLAGSAQAEEFARSLPLEALPAGAAVVDLVYKPRETTVLARARARGGLVCVDGLGMLLHQGALSFELWTGKPADVGAMAEALGGS